MGAGKWKPEYTKTLAGASVVILPDHDEPGEKHALKVGPELLAADCQVKIVRLPDLPKKGDVSDWIATGGTREQLQALVDRAPKLGPKRNLWKLSELLVDDEVMRPPPPVIPRFAWGARSTLLAAREKAGKSTLICYLASRVSNGGECLGEICQQGNVLLVGLEEYIGDGARKLRDFGADPERVYYMDSFLGEPKDRLEEVRGAIDLVKPIVVFVDSLVAYSRGSGIDENDAAMIDLVQPLTDLAHTTGAAIVIVHHASKATGRARGSTAITGGTDVVCEFSIPEETETDDPTLRRVRTVGRVPVPRLYDVRFVDDDHYELASAQALPLDQRLLALITEHPGLTSNEVVHKAGGNKRTILTALSQLSHKGDLEARAGKRNSVLWWPRSSSLRI